jgi:hypothetical protein
MPALWPRTWGPLFLDGLRFGGARWKMPLISAEATGGQPFGKPMHSVRKGGNKMRSIPFILAAFAFSAPGLAQSWENTAIPSTPSRSPFRSIRRSKR